MASQFWATLFTAGPRLHASASMPQQIQFFAILKQEKRFSVGHADRFLRQIRALAPPNGADRTCGKTNAFRLDPWSGGRTAGRGFMSISLENYLLAQSETAPAPGAGTQLILDLGMGKASPRAALTIKGCGGSSKKLPPEAACPQLFFAAKTPLKNSSLLENGIQFALRFSEGYSVGLFLDQRENRRRAPDPLRCERFFSPHR